jgi:GTPase KRas protein
VYSVTHRSSFEKVYHHLNEIYRSKDLDNVTLPIVLVGNKIDLEDERVVSFEEGKDLAKDCNIPIFTECSALSNKNIEHIFIELTKFCRKFNNTKSNPSNNRQPKKCHIM